MVKWKSLFWLPQGTLSCGAGVWQAPQENIHSLHGNTSQRWAGRGREAVCRHQELQDERDEEGGRGLHLCALTHGPTSDGGGLTWMLFSCRFR